MSTPLHVTGYWERGRAAREEEQKARHVRKSNTEAEITRLRAVNAELHNSLRKILILISAPMSSDAMVEYFKAYLEEDARNALKKAGVQSE